MTMQLSFSVTLEDFDQPHLFENSLDSVNTVSNFTNLNNTLVVIDAGVSDASQLVADVMSRAKVLLLEQGRDGIEQITSALKHLPNLQQLHILSHGSPGSLLLGNARLSLETVQHYTKKLKEWSSVLSSADILLYGCQAGQGNLGKRFLQQLHQLTGANLAAAESRVGNGDWNLEAQIGRPNSEIIFSKSLQQSYSSYFAPTVSLGLSPNRVIENENTLTTWSFNLSEPPPVGGTVVRFAGDSPQVITQWDLFQLDFSGLAGTPEDVSPNLDFSAFNLTIVDQNASISIPIFNDFIDEGPTPVAWSISPVSGGTVNPAASSALVTIYDDASQLPGPVPPPPGPVTPPPSPAMPGPVRISQALNEIGGLDRNFYLAANPDVAASGIDPQTHYLNFGFRKGRDPRILFDASYYLGQNPDVANAINAGAVSDPLTHYVQFGARAGRDPSPYFDTSDYLLNNPDVAQAGANPLGHYVSFGARAGRDPNSIFDSDFYLSTYPDIAAAGINPMEHYIQFGATEGRSASASFNPSSYLAANPDVAAAGVEALGHYLQFGITAGRPIA